MYLIQTINYKELIGNIQKADSEINFVHVRYTCSTLLDTN
jgi:hypothetical protein